MTREELNARYFDYMCSLVCSGKRRRGSYRKLLMLMNSVDFYYILPMDANRSEDGIELRYRFGADESVPEAEIATLLDIRPCSVLEMLVALCVRCEESIMDAPDSEDKTGDWFFEMIESLGLVSMTDSRFSRRRALEIIHVFLDRNYEADGSGGLFYIPDCTEDLRGTEIWHQMMLYLTARFRSSKF